MNLNRMAVFAAVVERGSFTAAAQVVGLTKSMVSQHVSALEDELGVRLMQRTTRSLMLTEAGEVYYQGCQKVAEEAAALAVRLQNLKDEPEGKLRITTLVDYAMGPFAAKLTAFLQLYPRVSVELVVREGIVDLLAERIDVAFRLGWLRDSTLAATRVGDFEQLVVASPSFLAKAPPLKTPADLDRVEVLALSLLRHPRKHTFKDGAGRSHVVNTHGRVTVDSPSAMRALAVEGAGVAVLGRFMLDRDLAEGTLIRLLPGYALPRGGIFAVLPSRRAAPPKVRALLEFLKARR
jgi:DNA-binding transcriptional LysR family regulator